MHLYSAQRANIKSHDPYLHTNIWVGVDTYFIGKKP